MARPLRVEFPGAIYHVTARGNEKQVIFSDRRDRVKFLDYLEKATKRYGAVIHSYCLMNNHYHLLLETPAGNLSQITRYLNGAYSTYFNKRHDRVGHLFQGRYKSPLVDADGYLLQLSRYIHMNPVRGEIVEKPWDYEWSSCRFFVGKGPVPEWLCCKFLLDFFNSGESSYRMYRKYLSDYVDSNVQIKNSLNLCSTILGSDEFIETVYDERLRNVKLSRDVPDPARPKATVNIQAVFDVVAEELNYDERLAKKMSIYLCHRFSRHSLRDIGENFGIGESAVSLTSSRFAAILHTDQRLAESVAKVLSALNL